MVTQICLQIQDPVLSEDDISVESGAGDGTVRSLLWDWCVAGRGVGRTELDVLKFKGLKESGKSIQDLYHQSTAKGPRNTATLLQ